MPHQASENLHTVGDCLNFAITLFKNANLAFGHGSTNARDEAAYLLLHTLGLPLNRLDLKRKLAKTEITAFLDILAPRVKKRIPAAYLTKEAWLGDYNFYVDERAIVPRSFIAELLLQRLSPWIKHPNKVSKVLELCTGSGCLAIIASKAFPKSIVDASDLSSQALEVAKINIKNYALNHRLHLIQSDLFDNIPRKQYDFIIANPPYVDSAAMRVLPKEYRYEPRISLFGGRNGLDIVHRIIATAANYLTKSGFLILEIGHHRAELEKYYAHTELIWLETLAGSDYVVLFDQEMLKSAARALPAKSRPIKKIRRALPRGNASRNAR